MLLKILGFIVGFAIVAALEVGILSAIHGMPRGLGWVVLPFVVGSALAAAAPGLVERFSNSGGALWCMHPGVRLVAALSGLWFVAVPIYWWLFEPYDGYRMYSDDYALMFKVLIFPVIVLVAGYIAYVKLKDEPGPADPKPLSETSSPSQSPLLVADELEKLAALRDKGLLTPEEFSAQKARLLEKSPPAAQSKTGRERLPSSEGNPLDALDRLAKGE